MVVLDHIMFDANPIEDLKGTIQGDVYTCSVDQFYPDPSTSVGKRSAWSVSPVDEG